MIGDVQGCDDALGRLLAALDFSPSRDTVVVLGDLVNRGPRSLDTLRFIKGLGGHAHTVLGNHDQAALRGPTEHMHAEARAAIEWTHHQLDDAQRAFLAQLPLTVEDEDRLYVHANAWAPANWGYITNARAATQSLAATRQRITFCGHMHEPALYHTRPGGLDAGHFTPRTDFPIPLAPTLRWLAIPGSVGQPRDGNPAACCGWMDTERNSLTCLRVPYDHEAASARILRAGLPPGFASRLGEGR